VDLTFAIHPAAGSKSECHPELHWNLVFASGPLILTFAKLAAEMEADVRIGPLDREECVQ